MPLRSLAPRVLPFVLVVLVAGLGLYAITRTRAPQYQTAVVVRGPIVGEALASGNVESPVTAKLRFMAAGKLATRPVRIGQEVKAGALLARQDTGILDAQLAQALSDVAAQEAQLRSLEDGTRPEQLAVSEAQVAADSVAVSRAKAAEADALRSAFTAADSAIQNALDPLFSNPRSPSPSLLFFTNDSSLESALESGRLSVGALVAEFGTRVAQIGEDPAPFEREADAALALVAAQLSQANAALAAAIPNQQASASQLTVWSASVAASRVSVNAAITALSAAITARQAAEAVLGKDEKTLALQRAGTTQAALDAQRAAVSSAEARASAIRAQIRNLEIRAPFSGTVLDVDGAPGETVGPETVVVLLQPHDELEIVANISEDSVVGVSAGDAVRIELDAFPRGTSFPGTVRTIAPAQTIEGGAVYYEARIAFAAAHEGVKPGMSVSAWIQTASSSDALIVPASALERSATSTAVRVLVGGGVETRLVTTGIESRDGRVEIRAGLVEGDAVIIGQ